MPKQATRFHLKVTDVRIERLTEITPEDAIAEGLTAITKDDLTVKYGIPDRDGLPGGCDIGWVWNKWDIDPREAFKTLWESISGPKSWVLNPWVWVYSFEKI